MVGWLVGVFLMFIFKQSPEGRCKWNQRFNFKKAKEKMGLFVRSRNNQQCQPQRSSIMWVLYGKAPSGAKPGELVWFDSVVTEFTISSSDLTLILVSPSQEKKKLMLHGVQRAGRMKRSALISLCALLWGWSSSGCVKKIEWKIQNQIMQET